MPILYMLTGTPLRGLKAASGKWWLALAIWLVLAVPLSVWRFGSASMLFGCIPKNYMLFLFHHRLGRHLSSMQAIHVCSGRRAPVPTGETTS